MFTHGPSCLEGPVSRERGWWTPASDADVRAGTDPGISPTPSMNEKTNPAPRPEADIRVDLVERVRREIATGTYDTPEKWAIALQRLLERLEPED
jgi:hypothetical protein